MEATLDKVRARFPEGLKARATYDTTVFVKDTMHEVVKTLFEAFVLVALVVFVFLGNMRATIIPVIAVPDARQLLREQFQFVRSNLASQS